MAGKKRQKVQSDEIVGFKYFKVLAGMLETLHDAACARDRAHNRILHMDQYITLLLMYMFNPVCSSLRTLQQASTLEIFFRFFKHVLGCRHLLSHCDNGIELQTYAAIIACLLIALWTGRKPTLSTYRMLNWYFTGWADEDELLAHIETLKAQDDSGAVA